ncbi:hypothetical protein [Aquamicrobium terrae]|uniref:Lipoprotein n=1 Tax=Aquamicrobium terrae TaxID=1324945 RepID=A0ABV2N441_9HYPH
MLLRTTAVIVLGFLLSGCMTAEQQRAADEEKCRSYGFTRKNDAFAECLQRIELDRRAAARETRYIDPFPRVVYRPVYVPVRAK